MNAPATAPRQAPLICQARITENGPRCGARAEWALSLADGLVQVYTCQEHRDWLARVFASLTPDPERWFEAILSRARRCV